VVTPREAFEAREARVELVRRELVLRDDGNHHETVEARETVAGRARFHPRNSQGYAFGVVVSRNLSCPSSETARTYVGWFLRGVIDRGPRPDHAVEQELQRLRRTTRGSERLRDAHSWACSHGYVGLGKGERYGQPSVDRRALYNAGSKPASSTS
jgi:hypothetical protein